LEDYFEVDGKMLCERHARMERLSDTQELADEESWARSTKAMKRKTRFMNLAAR
jgi:PDZ and LIM domain protein 5/6/7